jgi:hypothetical protein
MVDMVRGIQDDRMQIEQPKCTRDGKLRSIVDTFFAELFSRDKLLSELAGIGQGTAGT